MEIIFLISKSRAKGKSSLLHKIRSAIGNFVFRREARLNKLKAPLLVHDFEKGAEKVLSKFLSLPPWQTDLSSLKNKQERLTKFREAYIIEKGENDPRVERLERLCLERIEMHNFNSLQCLSFRCGCCLCEISRLEQKHQLKWLDFQKKVQESAEFWYCSEFTDFTRQNKEVLESAQQVYNELAQIQWKPSLKTLLDGYSSLLMSCGEKTQF